MQMLGIYYLATKTIIFTIIKEKVNPNLESPSTAKVNFEFRE